jgi:hypothetical protein
MTVAYNFPSPFKQLTIGENVRIRLKTLRHKMLSIPSIIEKCDDKITVKLRVKNKMAKTSLINASCLSKKDKISRKNASYSSPKGKISRIYENLNTGFGKTGSERQNRTVCLKGFLIELPSYFLHITKMALHMNRRNWIAKLCDRVQVQFTQSG